jgi:hypothetical protein
VLEEFMLEARITVEIVYNMHWVEPAVVYGSFRAPPSRELTRRVGP